MACQSEAPSVLDKCAVTTLLSTRARMRGYACVGACLFGCMICDCFFLLSKAAFLFVSRSQMKVSPVDLQPRALLQLGGASTGTRHAPCCLLPMDADGGVIHSTVPGILTSP